MQISDVQNEQLTELFASTPDTEEVKVAKERFVIRFNPKTQNIYKPAGYRKKLPGVTFLWYTERPAQTPTGGRYVRRSVAVRGPDCKLWTGTLKTGTDVVRLRRMPTVTNVETE